MIDPAAGSVATAGVVLFYSVEVEKLRQLMQNPATVEDNPPALPPHREREQNQVHAL